MNVQPQLLQIPLDPQDVVYTPDWAARDMVEYFKPSGSILEPCKGGGVFLKYLPSNTDWCEIEQGRDFFAWIKPVDWLFGNPPYRMFGKWMYHSFEIAENIVYLLPLDKPFISGKMMRTMKAWGRVKHMRFYGMGTELGFPMGFAVGALHFQKGYHGDMSWSWYE
jgi:hypothetical protein